jgi:hypothetical protein
MKRILLFLPLALLTACAHEKIVTDQPVIYPRDAWGNSVPADSVANLRQASRLHTYLINDYIDPNNPRIRHQGHSVDVVEQDETWNLHPSGTMVANLGPVTAVSDPASMPNPYTAEFETELVQQRDQNGQLADMGRRMSEQLQKLQDMAQKSAAVTADNDALQQRIDQLQKEIESLKTTPLPPPSASSKSRGSWLDAVKGMFQKPPSRLTPTGQITPSFRVSVAVREPETPFPAPGVVLPSGFVIASASLPQEFFRMPLQDEARVRITAPMRSSSRNEDDLPPLPQP